MLERSRQFGADSRDDRRRAQNAHPVGSRALQDINTANVCERVDLRPCPWPRCLVPGAHALATVKCTPATVATPARPAHLASHLATHCCVLQRRGLCVDSLQRTGTGCWRGLERRVLQTMRLSSLGWLVRRVRIHRPPPGQFFRCHAPTDDGCGASALGPAPAPVLGARRVVDTKPVSQGTQMRTRLIAGGLVAAGVLLGGYWLTKGDAPESIGNGSYAAALQTPASEEPVADASSAETVPTTESGSTGPPDDADACAGGSGELRAAVGPEDLLRVRPERPQRLHGQRR